MAETVNMQVLKTNIIKKSVLTGILLLVFTLGCKKDEYIPEVLFNVYLDLNMISYQHLKTPGNYEYVDKSPTSNEQVGYRGIIVYCVYQNEYVALERACPYHPSADSAVVEVDSTGIFAECPVCGSRFQLMDGSITEGPASLPLKQYNTSLQDHYLNIYN